MSGIDKLKILGICFIIVGLFVIAIEIGIFIEQRRAINELEKEIASKKQRIIEE